MNIVGWNVKNIFTVFLMVMIVSVAVGFISCGVKKVFTKQKDMEDA